MIPLAIPSSGPLFEGHFPGRPILPGIGLLDLALRALGDVARDRTLRGIDHFKWRSLVVPGETLALHARPPATGGGISLEIRRGPEVVAGGVLTPGDPGPHAPIAAAGGRLAPAGDARVPATGAAGPPGATSTSHPPLDRLLPHGAPMRFVAAVEAEPEDGIACTARVPAGGPFAPDGTAPAFVAIEMAAQAAAVFEALRRFRAAGGGPAIDRAGGDSGVDRPGGAGPRIGYLVGARGVRFHRGTLPAGAACRVAIQLAGVAGPLSGYRFDVERQGDRVATGTLSTWITATDA